MGYRFNIGVSSFFVALLISFVACAPIQEETGEDVVLAKAHNKTLYLSELDGMIPQNVSEQDSVMVVNAYIERWTRKALMLHEAERNLPKDLDIDGLVRDYRASLILHNYEQMLVEQELDSTIAQAELNTYYEKNKEQYQLESSIIRCNFIKIPTSAPDIKDAKKWWEQEDSLKLMKYCNTFAESFLLEDSTWHKVDDIAAEFPKGTFNKSMKSNRTLSLKDGDYHYFLKVLEKKSQKEIAPLEFIRGQATKFILHNKKIKLLEQKKEELYEKGIRRNYVKIFTQ